MPLRPSGYDSRLSLPWLGFHPSSGHRDPTNHPVQPKQQNEAKQNKKSCTENDLLALLQAEICVSWPPACPAEKMGPDTTFTPGRCPRARNKERTQPPLWERQEEPCFWKVQGRLWSALVWVVTSWRGVAAESYVGAGHTGPHGPWSTLVQPFPPLQAKPTHVSGRRGPPVTGGRWVSSVEAELTALTQPSSRLLSCSRA